MPLLDQTWFSSIGRPSRYLGNEINAVRKHPSTTEVSVALAFPDVYEVGMSHLGMKILYHTMNNCDWLTAERVFCPWEDLERELRRRKLPLTTLECARPLSDFDILGFSLQHELSFTNVLTMLDLSGIPFLSDEREDLFPLVIAGGPACFNPEPAASLFDAILIGDGEEAAVEVCQKIREAKRSNVRGKDEILVELAKIRGVYVPSFFGVHYRPDGIIESVQSSMAGYEKVEKAIVPDLDQYDYPCGQVVPFTELVHDRLAIEICRGCGRGCRFCQAGMIYRPVRERNPESVVRDVQRALRLTGFEELSLLSLSTADYCCLGALLKELMDRQSKDKIAISLPSLRVDAMDPGWLEQIKRVRKTGFTLAPEAGNDRLRRIINKALTDRDILSMAGAVYGAGWNLIKLYFMTGLPGEDDGDLRDIVRLAKKVANLAKGKWGRSKLNIHLSTFVPKSHTPFMWVPQISLEESQRRIQLIRDGLRRTRVRVKWNQPELSWLEGIFSRGDRKLTRILIEAWRLGARFDAWRERLRMDAWAEAFRRCRLDPEFYLYRQRSTEEVLPWDHIDSGVNKIHFKTEWKRALKEEITPDCREKCIECGVCDHRRIDPIIFRKCPAPLKTEKPVSNQIVAVTKKYRLTFSKIGSARFLSHLEIARVFNRALRRAGLDLVYSQGYHPMPKISFASALPVGTESLHETIDIEVYQTMPVADMIDGINHQLPIGIGVRGLEDITEGRKKPRLKQSHYQITMNGLELDRAHLDKFLQSEYYPIPKSSKKGKKIIDARPAVVSMDLVPPNRLDLVITHLSGPQVKPMEIVGGVFHLGEDNAKHGRVLKTKQVMG